MKATYLAVPKYHLGLWVDILATIGLTVALARWLISPVSSDIQNELEEKPAEKHKPIVRDAFGDPNKRDQWEKPN